VTRAHETDSPFSDIIDAMAALSEHRPGPSLGPLLDLRDVSPSFLDSLLDQETAEWMTNLDWDFEPSASLVRRFIGMRALTGFALPDPNARGGSQAAGYVYYVADEDKGLVGGLYVARTSRTDENENLLLSAVLDAMWRMPGLHRIEAQLMMLASPLDRTMPYASRFRPYSRQFMEVSNVEIAALPPRDLAISISPWAESRRGDAARLIAQAYSGHIDSQINDQYRSSAGARRFLTNIVEYPGCGSFFTPGSFVALAGGPRSSSNQPLAGMSLASLVAPGVGHITQVCVAPAYRGIGLGYELLRRSLVSLAAHGCNKVSLTVTSANEAAATVYRRMGFVTRREFAAYVWELR
jgi:ribosomal protein S18 acetylase RimI-like enzyme